MTQLKRRTLLVFVVLLHLLVDAAVMSASESIDEIAGVAKYLGPFFAGVVLGQFAMLAAYLAWGPEHWLTRWFTACFLVILMWYALAFGAASTGNSFSVSSIEQLLGILTIILLIYIPIPYWVVRVLFRRRIRLIRRSTRLNSPKSQFSIRRLLVWTGVVAVIMAIGRSNVGYELRSGFSMTSSDALRILSGMLIPALYCVLPAIPATWASLVDRNPVRPLVIVGVYTGILIAIESTIVFMIGGNNFLLEIAGINLGILVDVVACSLLLRMCGLRFMRRDACSIELATPDPT